MSSRISSKYCLATVTTKSFITGTAVLIHSFLEKNTWFDGDIVVVAEIRELLQQEIDILCAFNNLKIVDVSPELLKNARVLEAANPSFAGKSAQFFSLEAFKLFGYEKVLFCDSDLLFLDSIETLFDFKRPLLCCGDGPYYQGLSRNKLTFSPDISQSPDKELANTFNAGFMLIDQSLINESTYHSLLDMTTREHWIDMTTLHTDQRIFNLFFNGQQTIISPIYNFLLAHQYSIEALHATAFKDVKVFHFNGPAKPWFLGRCLCTINDNRLQYQAFHQWYRQYEKILASKHLQYLVKP